MHTPHALVTAAALLVSASLAAPSSAASPAPAPIEFAHGSSSAKVDGGIARGETARYTFTARADQWVELAVSSVESNAVAQVYGPGWRITPDGEIAGGDPQTESAEGASKWSGLLPANGAYLVEVGATRGGAEFHFTLTIRKPVSADCQELPQQPMNACYAAVATEVDGARGRAYSALEALLDKAEKARLAAAEHAWRAYADAECAFEAAPYEGGSLQPTIYGTCRIKLTTARQAELEQQLSDQKER